MEETKEFKKCRYCDKPVDSKTVALCKDHRHKRKQVVIPKSKKKATILIKDKHVF